MPASEPEPAQRTNARAQRLHADVRLHHAFRHIHTLGPRPTAYFLAETLDSVGADPAVLDAALTWQRRLDPDIVEAVGGADFPPLPLRVVPLS
jgi:hypothetical protein